MDICLCRTCANAFPVDAELPRRCPICDDERQFVPDSGQEWVRLSELDGSYAVTATEREPGLTAFAVTPELGIGQQTILVNTPGGNLLWEPSGYVDDDLRDAVADRGGVAAVASSHPHLVGSSVVWAEEFDAPLYVNADDQRWITHSHRRLELWHTRRAILPGITLVQCGGHFAGSAVAHWASGADGRGVLLTGDTIAVTPRGTVSFMRSYPNNLPLSQRLVRQLIATIEPYAYDRIYGSFGRVIDHGAADVVTHSAERYIGWLTDRIRDPDERRLAPVSA